MSAGVTAHGKSVNGPGAAAAGGMSAGAADGGGGGGASAGAGAGAGADGGMSAGAGCAVSTWLMVSDMALEEPVPSCGNIASSRGMSMERTDSSSATWRCDEMR